MRLPLAIGAVVVVLVTAASAYASPAIQNDMIDPSVKVGDGCSGQVVSSKFNTASGGFDTIVITAKHCVDDIKPAETVSVASPQYDASTRLVGELVYYGSVVAKDPKGDLALIRLHDRKTFFKKVATVDDGKNPIQIGDSVWAAGFPKGWAITVTQGIAGPLERHNFSEGSDGEIEYRRASAQIAGGSSGGGLYRLTDAGYRLIGVTTGRASTDGWIAMWTPLEAIQEFLGRWVK